VSVTILCFLSQGVVVVSEGACVRTLQFVLKLDYPVNIVLEKDHDLSSKIHEILSSYVQFQVQFRIFLVMSNL